MDILKQLFIMDYPIEKSKYSNLYYSFDSISFVGFDIEILKKYKIYSDYIVDKELYKNLNEGYKEYKGIIRLIDKKIFIRIVFDERNLVMDILIYTIFNEVEEEKYKRIFFVEDINIPNELSNEKNTIVCLKNNHIFIVKNGDSFLNLIGFEEWDFKNKYLNELDTIMQDKSVLTLMENYKSFTNKYIFKKNGLGECYIECIFEYFNDGFYILKGHK